MAGLLFATGCTGNEQGPVQESSGITPVATSTSPLSSDYSLKPSPTDEVSDNFMVYIDAIKDPISGSVTVISRGGPGLYMVNTLDVKIYLSNGEIIEREIAPDVNSEVVFDEGTKGDDRVVVKATYDNGETYKVFDDLLIFRKKTDNK
ncbi:hypothetical protein F1737_03705 [Methanoplanus sp. FWC-SCC4]|uniref:Uncharacterized protein n=1 Tax=Methanochimaera problematica TaxID=2609417 RepID=A0AA97FBE5_9EURY|nr:hypothetical protein [Methanoplanus sp. FWC-SCC4]WOF15864.1 hypothetical protein F1737_03705 [Methanoplanus sp. FWC-SCC4]